MNDRVQKILSQWGIASRRQAETLILEGRVCINGQLAQLGQKVNPQVDCLEVDGQVVYPQNRPQSIVLLINKPLGFVSTCDDPQNRPTVLDLLPDSLRQGQGIHPVGRLDINSTGALLLTNDGELTLSLTHPRYHLPKTYQVWVAGHPSESVLQQWRNGVMLRGKRTLRAPIKVLRRTRQKTLLEVILTEGRNRQIRRIAQQLGFDVLGLQRVAIGIIQLNPPNEPSLPIGHYRLLKPFERDFLKNCINLATGKRRQQVSNYVSQKA